MSFELYKCHHSDCMLTHVTTIKSDVKCLGDSASVQNTLKAIMADANGGKHSYKIKVKDIVFSTVASYINSFGDYDRYPNKLINDKIKKWEKDMIAVFNIDADEFDYYILVKV